MAAHLFSHLCATCLSSTALFSWSSLRTSVNVNLPNYISLQSKTEILLVVDTVQFSGFQQTMFVSTSDPIIPHFIKPLQLSNFPVKCFPSSTSPSFYNLLFIALASQRTKGLVLKPPKYFCFCLSFHTSL